VLSYRVILDVPLPLVVFVSKLLADHRRENRHPERNARPDLLEAGALRAGLVPGPAGHPPAGPGVRNPRRPRRTGIRDEAVEVLAATAPTLREALDRAAEQGLPYLILDGTLISSDRCADKKNQQEGQADRHVVLREGA